MECGCKWHTLFPGRNLNILHELLPPPQRWVTPGWPLKYKIVEIQGRSSPSLWFIAWREASQESCPFWVVSSGFYVNKKYIFSVLSQDLEFFLTVASHILKHELCPLLYLIPSLQNDIYFFTCLSPLQACLWITFTLSLEPSIGEALTEDWWVEVNKEY